MPLTTLKDAKNSRLRQIAQSCPDDQEFLSLVNDATEMLMRRGSFWGTVQKVQVCTYNGCITWPRYVGTVLAINIGSHPLPLWNNWWDFMPMSRQDWCSGGFALSATGSCSGNIQAVEDGVTPVFNKIPCGQLNYIQVYLSALADVGKTVTLFGVDSNGQVARTMDSSGNLQEGETLTLASPFVRSKLQYQSITRITKDVTQGVVRYYQYNSSNQLLTDLVFHDPTETTPMYRHSRISRINNQNVSCAQAQTSCGTLCNGLRSVVALIKMDFIPVVADTDIIQIDNLQALKTMVMSIKAMEAEDPDKSERLEASSVRELNLEIRNKLPNSQIPIQVQCYGSAWLEKQSIGTLI